MKSIVSGELPAKIAQSFGVECVNVLTGFKFIAEKIKQYEEDHSHTFMFGFEESYGFLIQPYARDKDAIQAAMLFAEVVAFYKAQGKSVFDGLNELYQKYGYFIETTLPLTFSGQEGAEKIENIMSTLRQEQLKEIHQISVIKIEDYLQKEIIYANGEKKGLDMPPSNVLKYYLEDGTWIAVRPSGTEPKIKFYIGTQGSNAIEAQEKVEQFIQVMKDLAK